jgi:hypothetical protein
MSFLVKAVRDAFSMHAVNKSFYRSVDLHGIYHVQVMEAHRSAVSIAHHDTARGARVDTLSVVELLATRTRATVICSA